MLLVGYSEGSPSQRRIDWRCADSPSLRKLLGIPLTESTLDHTSMTHVRERMLRLCFANLSAGYAPKSLFFGDCQRRAGLIEKSSLYKQLSEVLLASWQRLVRHSLHYVSCR